MKTEESLITLTLCVCGIFPMILVFLGMGLGFLQDSFCIATENQGFKWIPATAVGLGVGYLITLGLTINMNFTPTPLTGSTVFFRSWFFPFIWIGLVCSLFQIWVLQKRDALQYLGVAWISSVLGSGLGDLVNYQIQRIGWNCCSDEMFSYVFLGIWAHTLIVVAIYGIVTSGMLYLLSSRIRRYDRRVLLSSS